MTDSANNPPNKTQSRRNSTHRDGERNRGQSRPESVIAVIDRLLLNPVPITVNGKQSKVTALEAIMLQLLRKGMDGDARARSVMLKYQAFASQGVEKRLVTTFLDSAYTQSLANWTVGQADE